MQTFAHAVPLSNTTIQCY